jgi:hypothetical protein
VRDGMLPHFLWYNIWRFGKIFVSLPIPNKDHATNEKIIKHPVSDFVHAAHSSR